MSIAVPSLWLPHIASPFKKKKLSYAQTILQDSPAAYWRLQETSGTTAFDSSGNGYNGTYDSAIVLGATGPFSGEYAAQFPGTDLAWVTTASVPVLTTYPYSLEAWVFLTSAYTDHGAVFGSYGGSGGVFTDATGASLGVLDEQFLIGNGSIEFSIGTTPFPLSTWIYLVGTYDGTTMNLYINGLLNASGALASAPAWSNTVYAIGGEGWASSVPSMVGSMCECAVYPKVLSPTRIAAHYAASGL